MTALNSSLESLLFAEPLSVSPGFSEPSVLSLPVSYTGLNEKIRRFEPRLSRIARLGDNWDGQGAVPISAAAMANLSSLLEELPYHTLGLLSLEDIFPSPYGTLFLEIEKGQDEISVEVGDTELSYYGTIDGQDLENEFICGQNYGDTVALVRLLGQVLD